MSRIAITLVVLGSTVFLLSQPSPAAELTPQVVANTKGDGPDGKGNTADDTWQFWFELAHKKGHFHFLDTYSTSIPKAGIPRKVTGPVASWMPNKETIEGWIYHRDWDGRFEGVWGDTKGSQVIAYPYVEKGAHSAVAVTYKVPKSGKYDISGGLKDLQVAPKYKKHDGFDWRLEIAEGGKPVKKIGKGGPIGDGHGRPESDKFDFKGVEVQKGQLVRLVIHPRRWWGTDMTKIEAFTIAPSGTSKKSKK
jgi:hypothetical protein